MKKPKSSLKKSVSVILTLCILLPCISEFSVLSNAVSVNSSLIGINRPKIGSGMKVIPDGCTVYYGEYAQDSTDANDKQPIKWTVLLKDKAYLGDISASYDKFAYFPQKCVDSMSLLSDKVLDTCQFMDCDPSWPETSTKWDMPYSSSKLSRFLNGSFLTTAFTPNEIDAISNDPINIWGGSFTATTIHGYVTESIEMQVYEPDMYMQGPGAMSFNTVAPITTYAASRPWSEGCLEKNNYWLRTVPCYEGLTASNQGISENGAFIMGMGRARAKTVGIRPMTRIMNSHILMASQIGAKNEATVINESSPNIGEYKLTVFDTDKAFTANVTEPVFGETSADVTVNYSGADIGENEYISYILTDAYNNIYEYKRIQNVTSESGTINLSIPFSSFLGDNNCTLKIFNEKISDEKSTDYASTYAEVEIVRDKSLSYPIWIYGRQMNVENKDQYGYDPETNTLTILQRPYTSLPMNSTGYNKDGMYYGIYSEEDLTINLIGGGYGAYNTMYYTDFLAIAPYGSSVTAIYVNGDLTINGDNNGEFNIDCSRNDVSVPQSNGIICEGDLTVNNTIINVDTGAGNDMVGIKADKIALYNTTMTAGTQSGTGDFLTVEGVNGSYGIRCNSYIQYGGNVSLSQVRADYVKAALMLENEGEFLIDGMGTMSFEGLKTIEGVKTLEQIAADTDRYTLGDNGMRITANSCNNHSIFYSKISGRQMIIEECAYCKQNLGRVEMSAPSNLYYDGTGKTVYVHNSLPDYKDVEVQYVNLDTGYEGIPVEIGNYRATINVCGKQITENFSIVEDIGEGTPKTDFEILQEMLNGGGTISLNGWQAVYAEATDKPLVIPEGVSVVLQCGRHCDIDRSAASEPGPVFEVYGQLTLECITYVSDRYHQAIRGGTDSGIIVHEGGELYLTFDTSVEDNTANHPGAGIYCAGTLYQTYPTHMKNNLYNGKDSDIHLAKGGKFIYSNFYYDDLDKKTVSADDLSQPVVVAPEPGDDSRDVIYDRFLSDDDYHTTRYDKDKDQLYLIPVPTVEYGGYTDFGTTEESGNQTVNLSEFTNNSTLYVAENGHEGNIAYIKYAETEANKNVQLAYQRFALSMVVPANTSYSITYDFKLTMTKNASGTVGYYGEMFYLGDNPDKPLTFKRGDTSSRSAESSGKVYYESSGGGSKTISITVTYRNDNCYRKVIKQWFGFYAGIGKADKYNHNAVFEMTLAAPIEDTVETTFFPATHVYSGEWIIDDNCHHKICSICGLPGADENHVFENENTTHCDICGGQRYYPVTPSGIATTELSQLDFESKIIFTDAQGVTDYNTLFNIVDKPAYSYACSLYITPSLQYCGTGSKIAFTVGKNKIEYFRIIVQGDINGDSVCDVFDCFYAEQAQSGSIKLNSSQTLATDFDKNKSLDATDYQSLVNRALNKIE